MATSAVLVLGLTAPGIAQPLVSQASAPGLTGALRPTSTVADINPTQDTWFNYYKDLHDPTLTYTQDVRCTDFTPSGQVSLYPYSVPEGGAFSDRYAYRNNSSSGVTVTVNTAATSDLNGAGVAFFITSLHSKGDYAAKISIDCQSNDWISGTKVSPPTLQSVSSAGATIGATFSSSVQTQTIPIDYYVQYGTQYGNYPNRTASQTQTLARSGTTQGTMNVTGLQPSTTYHYRVVMVSHELNVGTYTNYSGADQTFTTSGPPTLNTPPQSLGYNLVAADGGVFSENTPYIGSSGTSPGAPIVGAASTVSGKGYWLVSADGSVTPFGDANYYGSLATVQLNKPVVGIAADPLTGGYWLVASDGGVFSFNAPFQGSTGALQLNKPVVGIAAAQASS